MSRARIFVSAAAALIAAAGGYFWMRAAPMAAEASPVSAPATADVGNLRVSAAQPTPSARSVKSAVAQSVDYASQYRNSEDLLAFIESIAPAAAAGDVEALYYLSRAARSCISNYKVYFSGGARELTLEQALVRNADARLDEQTTRELYRNCARFKAAKDNPYRDWKAALAAAAASGSARAQVDLAVEKQLAYVTTDDAIERERLRAEIHALAREAVRSADPEVVYQLSRLLNLDSKPEEYDATTPMVWMIAACQRGMDCGRDSEQFRFLCQSDPACQPFETIVDLMRREAGPRFDEIQLRANELNSKLDQHRFDEIGL